MSVVCRGVLPRTGLAPETPRGRKIGKDGGKLLTIQEIKKLRKYLSEKYGVALRVVDGDPTLKAKLRSWNRPSMKVVGSFNYKLRTMFIRSEVSELTVFHETSHLRKWWELGDEAYLGLSNWEHETYVWEDIWKTKDKWTDKELVESFIYVNQEREAAGISKIINKEMQELEKLYKLNFL